MCCHEGCDFYHRPTEKFYEFRKGLFECDRHHEERLSREQWPGPYSDNRQE